MRDVSTSLTATLELFDRAKSTRRLVRKAQVFTVPVKVRPDVVHSLEQLLQGAKAGDITGLAFAATLRGGRYVTDAAGECYDRPTYARGAIATLSDELSELIHQTDINERR